jgi:hypothetical protein
MGLFAYWNSDFKGPCLNMAVKKVFTPKCAHFTSVLFLEAIIS